MTAPDIVTEARQWINGLPPEVFDIDGPSRRVRDLVAEVERLRTALDQRTDPQLAAALLNCGVENRGGRNFAIVPIGEAMHAARLLGGDQ